MFDDRKEENDLLGSLLKPKGDKEFGDLREYKIEIDKHSLELINKANPLTCPYFKDVAIKERGIRHPVIAFIDPVKKILHVRAILGFPSITDKEQKRKFIQSVAAEFNCNEEDVAVPDTSLITGFVHHASTVS